MNCPADFEELIERRVEDLIRTSATHVAAANTILVSGLVRFAEHLGVSEGLSPREALDRVVEAARRRAGCTEG